jgi:diguanylate cyclase (GGDEF)-like protein
LIVLLITAGACLAVMLLIQRVDSSRRSQLAIGSLAQTVKHLEGAPFSADPAFNPDDPYIARRELARTVAREIRTDEATLSRGLSRASQPRGDSEVLGAGRASLADAKPAVRRVYELATQPGGLAAAGVTKAALAQNDLAQRLGGVSSALRQLDRAAGDSAQQARRQAKAGTAVALLLLLVVFGYFYFRSERLARENEELLGLSREEASTDLLTGLGNRRALTNELAEALSRAQTSQSHELLVAIFDLDGFKQYNDAFGHAAGDTLLARLGAGLALAVKRSGTTYRMGGDEFCMLAACTPDSAEALLDGALAALSDHGEGWEISCSLGAVWVPSEAANSVEALQIADARMYANKASRSSTGGQITDVLLQVLNEQDHGMNTHGDHVADLASEIGRMLHQSAQEVERIRLAAKLHDIGKTAIPESVLNKPGPLDEHDWEFMHRHTLIGERIVLAAPALASTAPLIRSSHERIDGNGYPDGLAGDEIPLGSRIIAVCDAFDAITSDRSYRRADTVDATLEELERCGGAQFDLEVVEALRKVVSKRFTAAITARTDSSV